MNMQTSVLARFAAAGLALLSPLILGSISRAADPKPADVRLWVSQLSSDDYTTREAATHRLLDAGPTVIDAVADAAIGGELEAKVRAVGILGQWIESTDVATSDAADAALIKVADAKVATSSELAERSMVRYDYAHEDKNIAQIRERGGRVLNILGINDGSGGLQEQELPPGQLDDIWVVLGGGWHGNARDVKLLRRLPGLEKLSVRGIQIGDDDIGPLEGLRSVLRVELYGTKVTSEGAARVAESSLQGAAVDRRGGALLGIACTPGAPCQINSVQPGSAAQRDGLQAGDTVTAFQGHPINDFETLTAEISKCHGGDKVTIEVSRPDGTNNPVPLKKEVTLGEWK